MNRRQKTQALPQPPAQYDQEWAWQLKRALDAYMAQNEVPGEIVGINPLYLKYPTNGYGLPSGSAWMDENGFQRIVRNEDIFAPTFLIRIRPVQVTIATS